MTADTVGGVWTYALQLCRALDAHGVHVVLATMGAPLSGSQHADVAVLHNVSLRESTFRLEWMRDPWGDVSAAGDWLLRLERDTAPDVVHLNGYAHAALPWWTPVLAVGHSCVLSWWDAVHGTVIPGDWERYRAAVTAGLRAAQIVVAPTRAMLDALARHYGPLPHGVVIPNGCDAGRRVRGHAKQPLVLAAGRIWDEAKNLRILADAAESLDWPVCVAGSDTRPDGTRQPIDGVRTLGALPASTMSEWYARASIFVHPALYEPFGLAPLEAALERCALVLADIESLREVWGDAAAYVPCSDSAALVRTVNELARDGARLESAAAAAHARARALNSVGMAARYMDAYRMMHTRAAALKGAFACVS